VLESLHDASPLTSVTGDQLRRAVDDLLDSSQQITRSLLGVGGDPDEEPFEAGAGSAGARPRVPGPAVHPSGWATYVPRRGRGGR
jgi:hypothetical protein